MRSPMRMASSASWVTTIAVARLCLRIASVSARTESFNLESRPENGSSISSTAGRGGERPGERHALLLAAGKECGKEEA